MKYILEIKEEAKEEIALAFLDYESAQIGLGKRFIDCFEKASNELTLNPKGCQKKHKNLRYKLIRPFPYIMIFEIDNDCIIVYQVINAKMHPKKRFKA